MGGDQAEFFILDPLLKGDDIFCHLPYFFYASAAFNVKGVQNILCLCAYGCLICDIVCDSPHLFPVKLLGVEEHAAVKVGFVNIEIHHTGIRSADLGNVGITESAPDLGRAAPVFYFCLYGGIASLDNAGNNGKPFAEALKVCGTFADSTAGIAFTEPGGNICMVIVQCFKFLYIHQYHRYIQITDGRQHVVGSGICQKLHEDQVDVRCTELVACSLRLLFGRDQPAVNQFNGIGNGLLESFILGFKFGHKGRKLRQICTQCNGKNTDSCFCVD